ncbi:Uncharacterised protein [Bordetella pertussis]|nr:Uncharacterised protein [Bordetella pertussis]CRE27476.1 Uncharacterised protein [Bordetella pertussis]CRE29979.1 Uncharacterised protein [Bordetella pertussis]
MVARCSCGRLCTSCHSFSWKCVPAGEGRPKKSFHWPTQMMTPIPAVKPTMTGAGMYLMMAPSRAAPSASRMQPAIRVASCRPATPCWAVMPARMTMKAPVGPAICTRLPPHSETSRPATMAVYRPCSGLAPLAMAKAMASGSATTPTIRPETILGSQWARRSRPARLASSRAITRRSRQATECGIVALRARLGHDPAQMAAQLSRAATRSRLGAGAPSKSSAVCRCSRCSSIRAQARSASPSRAAARKA